MTRLIDHSLDEQAIMLLAALVLFTSFLMLAQTRLTSLIKVFAWQGLLLAITTVLCAHIQQIPSVLFRRPHAGAERPPDPQDAGPAHRPL